MLLSKTKRIAMLAVMAALSTVLTVLGTVISVNTIFFTAAAAFLVGIVVVLYGMRAGCLYFCVCLALDFLINPNKLHGFLYLALAGYILISECSYRVIKKEKKHKFLRFFVFEVCYVPLVLFVPGLFVSNSLYKNSWFLPVMLVAGVVAWLVYDLAYTAAKKWFYAKFGAFFDVVKDNSSCSNDCHD